MAQATRFALFSVLTGLLGCASETRVSETRRETSYPGGYRIEVLKKDSYTQYTGLMTGHDYGSRHEYAYSFKLSPGRITWSGGSAEPKALVICGDQIYLRYLDIEIEEVDAGSELSRKMKAVARQAQLRDARWFFTLFGELSWLNVEPSAIPTHDCQEGAIPNAKELALGKPVAEP